MCGNLQNRYSYCTSGYGVLFYLYGIDAMVAGFGPEAIATCVGGQIESNLMEYGRWIWDAMNALSVKTMVLVKPNV